MAVKGFKRKIVDIISTDIKRYSRLVYDLKNQSPSFFKYPGFNGTGSGFERRHLRQKHRTFFKSA